MLVDHFQNALFGVGELVRQAHIVRVPYALNATNTAQWQDMLRKAPFNKRTNQWDASFAKPPYPVTAIISTQQESAFLLVVSARVGKDDPAIMNSALNVVRELVGHDRFDDWCATHLPPVDAGQWLLLPFICYEKSNGYRHVQVCCPIILGDRPEVGGSSEWTEEERERMATVIPILVTSFSLLNCSNIEQERVNPPAKVQEKRRARGKLPLLAYHILKVRPVRNAKGESRLGTGQPLAEHWVRGHFADYSQGSGMFGNPALKGRYWISPHLAGRAERTVMKDYEITEGVHA